LGHELETLVEAAQHVEHQCTVLNGFAKISRGICHGLHLAAVIVDRQGTLGESAKFGVEEHGAGLTVVEELLLKTEPSRLSSDTVAVVDDVQEVGGDGVEEL
jgi:hypothetical protein